MHDPRRARDDGWIVSGEDKGRSTRRVQVDQELDHLGARARVKAGCRLVSEHGNGLVHESPSQRHPLALPS